MQTELSYSAFESRYRDKQYIGSGGFAKVYKVFDHAKNHYVALKVADVRPEWDKFTLRNEVELVNKLPRHRNIARYDACYRFNTGFTGEMDFAVLRFYEYGNLEQFLRKQELTMEDRKLIVQGILDGILFLHNNNVIHRDLKSQNILLHREDGVWTPKITDFGLSREVLDDATITNSAIGISYAYAAPEQIQNKRIYRNVDIWAAGVTIYRIIADELPFKGRGGSDKSSQSQLELSRKIVNLELPEKLELLEEPYRTVIKRCLVYDPAKRAQTADELIQILNGNVAIDSDQLDQVTNSMPVDISNENKDSAISTATPESEAVADKSIDEESIVAISDKNKNIESDTKNVKPVEKKEVKIRVGKLVNVEAEKVNLEEVGLTTNNNHQPQVGDQKKSNRMLLWVTPILLLGLLSGGWYLLGSSNNDASKTPEVNAEIKVDELPPVSPSNLSSEDDLADIDEIEPEQDGSDSAPDNSSKEEPSSSVPAMHLDLLNFESRLLTSKNSERGLNKLEEEIQNFLTINNFEKDYRGDLLLAKLKSLQMNYRKASSFLRTSAKIAILNKEGEKMYDDLQKSEFLFFGQFVKISNGKKNWDRVIMALKRSIK